MITSPVLLNLLSVKIPIEWMPERDRKKKDGSFYFFPAQAHYSSKSLLSEMHLPKLLHFFVPALPTHQPTLCGWLFSLLRKHRLKFSDWLFYSPVPIATSLFCLLLLSFSLYYRLQAPASALSENSLILIELHHRNLLQAKPWSFAALPLKSQGKQNTFFCFCDFLLCVWLHVGERYQYWWGFKPCGL